MISEVSTSPALCSFDHHWPAFFHPLGVQAWREVAGSSMSLKSVTKCSIGSLQTCLSIGA